MERTLCESLKDKNNNNTEREPSNEQNITLEDDPPTMKEVEEAIKKIKKQQEPWREFYPSRIN